MKRFIITLGILMFGFVFWIGTAPAPVPPPCFPTVPIAPRLTKDRSNTNYQPVYGHSIVPGGVWNVDAVRDNPIYKELGFNTDLTRSFTLTQDQCVRTAYLRDGNVYWTKNCVWVRKGELIFTDGTYYIRARCGNLISLNPEGPTEEITVTDTEIPVGLIDVPQATEIPDVQGPIVPAPPASPESSTPFPPITIPTVPIIIPTGPTTRVPDGDRFWPMATVLGIIMAYIIFFKRRK
jgi:hypothetical protein